MKIPSKIKIGGIVYDIKLLSCKRDGLVEAKNWGCTSYEKCEITLDCDINPQQLEQTFFHEILHVISREYNAELKEINIDRISNGFYAFLKDNNLLKE